MERRNMLAAPALAEPESARRRIDGCHGQKALEQIPHYPPPGLGMARACKHNTLPTEIKHHGSHSGG